MEKETNNCGRFVSWWDGEYEGECELPKGHKGPHYDGISCFDDDGDGVEFKSRPIPPITAVISYYKSGGLHHKFTQVLNGNNNYLVVFEPEPGIKILTEIKS